MGECVPEDELDGETDCVSECCGVAEPESVSDIVLVTRVNFEGVLPVNLIIVLLESVLVSVTASLSVKVTSNDTDINCVLVADRDRDVSSVGVKDLLSRHDQLWLLESDRAAAENDVLTDIVFKPLVDFDAVRLVVEESRKEDEWLKVSSFDLVIDPEAVVDPSEREICAVALNVRDFATVSESLECENDDVTDLDLGRMLMDWVTDWRVNSLERDVERDKVAVPVTVCEPDC